MDYEYVVWDKMDDCIHRGPWTETECVNWIDELKKVFTNAKPGALDNIWQVRRRPVGDWETYE